MATWYSGRAYNAYGWPLGRLRLVSVDAGRVVNGVAEAEIVAVGPFAAWWRDIQYVDVWRYSGLGIVNRWECYQVRGWGDRFDNLKQTYALKGKSLTQMLAGRIATASTTAGTAPIASQAQMIVTSALGAYPVPLVVTTMTFDGPQESIVVKQSNQNALAGLQGLVNAAKAFTAPVAPQEFFNFAVNPVIRSDGSLALSVATWGGEYGADRRVDTGQRPLALWPKALTEKYEATRDESGVVTVVNLASSTVTNDTALNSPYGNYWAASDTSSGTEATANAYTTLWNNRPLTKMALALDVDVDSLPLGLGDVVSVVYGGGYVDGRVNVMHATWNDAGEKIAARIDIEI